MSRRASKPLYAIGVIERPDNHILIMRCGAEDAEPRLWHFPRGQARPGESPEAAMRRVALDQLDLHVEIVVGQPPLVEEIDGDSAELRYFFCGVVMGELQLGEHVARWVPKHHLREYEFDRASRFAAEWVLEE